MTRIYFMLAMAGWIWLAVLGGYVVWRLWRCRGEAAGVDVEPRD